MLGAAISPSLSLLLWVTILGSARGDDQREVEVGMNARIDQIVIPGPELEVIPHDDRSRPIVLRITATYPHGTNHRYDLVYSGLEPGEYDLTDYLRRKDGSAHEELPEIAVKVTAVLPQDRVRPNVLTSSESPSVGGYQTLVIVGSLLWLLGLVAILLIGRRRKLESEVTVDRPVTLADRLRPIVEEAIRGSLARERQAELERLLLTYWRRRLDLESTPAADAIQTLRQHPEAGELLRQLENWLHRPEPIGEVDVGALLAPYREATSDAGEVVPAS